MRFFIAMVCLLYIPVMQAHHTKDHRILFEGSEQVISSTQQGIEGGTVWLMWAGVIILLALGIVRWLNSHS